MQFYFWLVGTWPCFWHVTEYISYSRAVAAADVCARIRSLARTHDHWMSEGKTRSTLDTQPNSINNCIIFNVSYRWYCSLCGGDQLFRLVHSFVIIIYRQNTNEKKNKWFSGTSESTKCVVCVCVLFFSSLIRCLCEWCVLCVCCTHTEQTKIWIRFGRAAFRFRLNS